MPEQLLNESPAVASLTTAAHDRGKTRTKNNMMVTDFHRYIRTEKSVSKINYIYVHTVISMLILFALFFHYASNRARSSERSSQLSNDWRLFMR